MTYAPLIVFAYNRVDKIQRCIKSLEECELTRETDLFIFADGYKSNKDKDDVKRVQDWIRAYGGRSEEGNTSQFKSITIRAQEKNQGLANSIIAGVTEVMSMYGRCIVVEDDLVVSKGFLRYMNDSLEYFKTDSRIWSIASYSEQLKALHGYKHDIYLAYRASSWGWASWQDRWETVDWEVKDYPLLEADKKLQSQFCRGGGDLFPMLQRQMKGELDSWAIRWNYSASKQNKLTIYPKIGYISNEGFDGSGTHTVGKAPSNTIGARGKIRLEHLEIDPKITKEFYIVHTDTLLKKIRRNASLNGVIRIIKRFARSK